MWVAECRQTKRLECIRNPPKEAPAELSTPSLMIGKGFYHHSEHPPRHARREREREWMGERGMEEEKKDFHSPVTADGREEKRKNKKIGLCRGCHRPPATPLSHQGPARFFTTSVIYSRIIQVCQRSTSGFCKRFHVGFTTDVPASHQ